MITKADVKEDSKIVRIKASIQVQPDSFKVTPDWEDLERQIDSKSSNLGDAERKGLSIEVVLPEGLIYGLPVEWVMDGT